jgi:non-heme chloroperoxidase
MATIRVGDSTTMYYKDWGEGPFVAFRTAGRWIPALGQMLFLAQNGFRVR